jgi:serine/threonine-protein kinase
MKKNPVGSDSEIDDRVGELAESFLERHRQGERPTIEEYAARYPELASRIRAVFPTLRLVEELGPMADQSAADLPREPEVSVPSRIGDYRIIREIGRGGMGVVFEAEQISLTRRVALKVLVHVAAVDPRLIERFHVEARSAGRLHHPRIIPVYDVGETDGFHYYAMQLIDGRGLDRVLAEIRTTRAGAGDPSTLAGGAPTERAPRHNEAMRDAEGTSGGSPDNRQDRPDQRSAITDSHPQRYCREVARIGMHVAESLEYAHAAGILHRDIKPSNLILDRQGDIWVADFGLAKAFDTADPAAKGGLTITGDIVGTMRYMAPERFRGWSDPRSDVYGLGITLYELLTLRPVFDTDDRVLLMEQVLHAAPRLPRDIDRRIPVDLETIVLKAIDKEPARRYSSASELAADLRSFLEYRPILARRARLAEVAAQWCRRNPMVAGMAAMLTLAILAGLVSTTVLWRRAVRLHAESQQNLAAARKNLDLAVGAVDRFCTQVSQDEQLKQADLSDLRRKLLGTAVEFHEELLKQRGETELARIDLARSQARLAQLIGETDDFNLAIGRFQTALTEFEQLARDAPHDPAIQLDLARCLGGMGRFMITGVEPSDAEAPLQRAIQLLRGMRLQQPDNIEILEYLHDDLRSLAFMLSGTGRERESETLLSEAIEIGEALCRKEANSPDRKRMLAVARFQLGSVYKNLGPRSWPKARDQFTAAYATMTSISSPDLAGVENQHVLAKTLQNLGWTCRVIGETDEALSHLGEAVRINQTLVDQRSSVQSYWGSFAEASHELAVTQEMAGKTTEAAGSLQRAMETLDRLTKKGPGNSNWECRLADTLTRLADIAARQNQVDEALEKYGRSIELLESVLRREPTYLNATTLLNNALDARAQLLTDQLRFAESLADWDRLLKLPATILTPWCRVRRAWTVACLGDHAQAVREVEDAFQVLTAHAGSAEMQDVYLLGGRICAQAAKAAAQDDALSASRRRELAESYGTSAVNLIHRAIEAGYHDPQELRESPDFAPLRPRDDFAALVSSLPER